MLHVTLVPDSCDNKLFLNSSQKTLAISILSLYYSYILLSSFIMSSLHSNHLVWLVTGCSSGLGVDIVKEALKRGDKVIATARNAERIRPLEQEVGDNVKILDLDITKPPEQIREVIHDALGIWGHIDVVVNNAAVGDIGPVECTRCGIRASPNDPHSDNRIVTKYSEISLKETSLGRSTSPKPYYHTFVNDTRAP